VFLDAAESSALDRLESEVGPVSRRLITGMACVPGVYARLSPICQMTRGYTDTVRDFRNAPPLRSDVPLVVMSAETTDKLGVGIGWLDQRINAYTGDRIPLAQQFAKRSTRGTWKLVPGSDHLIGNSQPHAVATEVLAMIADVRRGR
jgi:hypothetical protein